MKEKADIGLIGLAVMGENLVLNMERNGYTVAVFNRTVSKVDDFLNGRGKDKNFIGTHSLPELVESLEHPRKIMMLVKAGDPVDIFIEQLIPLLDEGDIIIDGGNSNYQDTIRRTKYIESKGILYVGSGVSGGEEGALNGPSLMPGGSFGAWQHIKPIFQSIAAKVDDGTPCCDWVGKSGSGHFVKMVHNGIEYGDMQLISEAYFLMREVLGMTPDEQAEVFEKWNKGKLDSYLIEITSEILRFKDTDGKPLVDNIMDTAGQKGTGKWTVVSALEYDIPLTLIGESVFSRFLSSQKALRVRISNEITREKPVSDEDKEQFLNDLESALYASKIISYAQGYDLMTHVSKQFEWGLNFGGIALMWRGGCIIRSAFLKNIKQAYDVNPQLENLLLDDFFKKELIAAQESWRRISIAGIKHGISIPAMTSALAYFDGIRTASLPANMLQAQRDYFGAHQYERIDAPQGEFFHTDWTGHGGDTASTPYEI